jgi:pimeloyl-ACP methyl ester carboxylesterase
VLVHGIGMGRGVFQGLTEMLLPHGRVVAVDLPGYGEAPEPTRTPTMERMADMVAALLREHAYPDVVLIGHSMGTQVATEVAVRHPDVLSKLVLAAPTVNLAERTARRQFARLAQDLAREKPIVFVRGGREYLRAGPNLRRKMRAMVAHRPEDSYPRIAAPTLVIRGEHDRVCPIGWCEAVVAAIPDSRFAEIEDHGHETMIRDAGPAAQAIIGFL